MLNDRYARAHLRRTSRSQSSVADFSEGSEEEGDVASIVAPDADDIDVPDLDRVECLSREVWI